MLETGAPQPAALVTTGPEYPAPWRAAGGPVVGAFSFWPRRPARRWIGSCRPAGGWRHRLPAPTLARALALTPPQRVKVVILGQDPYRARQATAWRSTCRQAKAPGAAHAAEPAQHLQGAGAQLRAARRSRAPRPAGALGPPGGVLLLNTSLTVEAARAAAPRPAGVGRRSPTPCWRTWLHPAPRAYLLWGAHAQARAPRAQPGVPQLVLTANHPSPLSALRPPEPFIGCDHFRKANAFLVAQGQSRLTGWASTWRTGRRRAPRPEGCRLAGSPHLVA